MGISDIFSFGGSSSPSTSSGSSSFGSYFWPAAIMATTQLVGGLFQQNAQEKENEKARQEAEKQSALNFERQKELLALQPGPAGPFTGITDAQKVQAIQNQQQLELNSLDQLINAYQRAVLK